MQGTVVPSQLEYLYSSIFANSVEDYPRQVTFAVTIHLFFFFFFYIAILSEHSSYVRYIYLSSII